MARIYSEVAGSSTPNLPFLPVARPLPIQAFRFLSARAAVYSPV